MNAARGDRTARRQGSAVFFDVGEWMSTIASRRNDDRTISLITIDPTLDGFEFVVSCKDGKRALVIRDMQHEDVFQEAAGG